MLGKSLWAGGVLVLRRLTASLCPPGGCSKNRGAPGVRVGRSSLWPFLFVGDVSLPGGATYREVQTNKEGSLKRRPDAGFFFAGRAAHPSPCGRARARSRIAGGHEPPLGLTRVVAKAGAKRRASASGNVSTARPYFLTL